MCPHICKNLPLPSPVTCHDCFNHTHRSLHAAPLLRPTPSPSSKQPPPGLVRANPALDSVAPIAAPPLLRVVREMKALGVHYKTTTAAAGDRPPGATSSPFSSLHPQLFSSCPPIISAPVYSTVLVPHLTRDKNEAFELHEVKY